MIILLFGQPASGKTTLAKKYISLENNEKIVHIDGDRWRDLTKNKDYSKEGRLTNLKGAFNMALYLENEGFLPILSFVTPYEELRQYLLENSKHLVQIYLTYNEDRGRNMNFANDFEKPEKNYLQLDTSLLTIDGCIKEIKDYIQK